MLQIIVDVLKGDLDSLCLLPFCLGRIEFSDGCLLTMQGCSVLRSSEYKSSNPDRGKHHLG